MLWSELSIIAGVIFTFVTILFLVSVIIKRNDIADIAWGTGILLVAATSYLLQETPSLIMSIILTLVFLWGTRLTLRIFLRNIKKDEDYRYKKWRDEWGRFFYLRSYFQVYLLQGILMIVVGYSTVHASVYATNLELGITVIAGIILWSIGYFFEVVGDYQLDRFIKSKPASGSVMSSGLWRYSRHPNYFGEVTMWWAIWLIISSLPLSYLALISPLTITFLIFRVSGIPMLEKSFDNNPNFQEYKKRTSVFFPLPPKT
jgi:steroid 5-alpha reductase family enzyme